jgi:ATP-binding cassette subfamily B protein
MLAQFWPYLWPRDLPLARVRLVLALGALMLSKAAVLAGPLTFKYILEFATRPQWEVFPFGLLGLYVVARLLGALFSEVRDISFARASERTVRQLATHVFEHLHNLSLRYHLERQTGGLNRIVERGTKSVETMLTFLTFNILPTCVETLLMCITLGWMYGWPFSLIIIITMIGYVSYTLHITNWRLSFIKTMNESDNKAQTKAMDSLLNYETVKYFCNEEHERARYDEAMQSYENAAVQSKFTLSVLNVGQAVIISLGLVVNLFFTLQGIQKGALTVGDLVVVNTLLIQLYWPLFNLGFAYREIKTGIMNLRTMFELLAEPEDVYDAPNAPPISIHGGVIEFKDVHFAYQPERPIIKGLSFTIPAGQSVAVVGASGAGKSTLSRLLYRFYDVQQGAITIDGQDIRHVTQASLRAAIGIVPQDTVLFNDTIAYNIAYGRPHASVDEIIQAAQQAHIHTFIMSLPEQYNTRVGERGLKLSGGEKQRVAIARMILKNPAILVLDEATSALDTQTERSIQENLMALARSRTTLIIAHRLSTIVDADTIIVLTDGRIAEQGSHKDLLAKGGAYAQLWAQQQQSS